MANKRTDGMDERNEALVDEAAAAADAEPAAMLKLSRDMREAAKRMGRGEVRFLVDAYYMMQDQRLRTANQVRALSSSAEPHAVIAWMLKNMRAFERQVAGALGVWARHEPLCVWPMAQCGVGPILAAGLAAHVDLSRAATAGAIWRFAGLADGTRWVKRAAADAYVKERGASPETAAAAAADFGLRAETVMAFATRSPQGGSRALTAATLSAAISRRPWNADLKVLCWKIGESFVKVHNREDAFYGKIYAARKELEAGRNARGEYAAQAAAGAARVGKSTEAYKHYAAGRLPPGHLHARAKRFAVKLFLSHWHEVGRKSLGLPLPAPWVIVHGGHAHYIAPPPPSAEEVVNSQIR